MDRSSLRLVVFDWDGTLADSHTKIVSCFRTTADEIGVRALPDDRLRSVIGLGLPQAIHTLYPEADAALVGRFVETYRKHWLAPDSPKARLFAGARDCLDTLRKRGLEMCIATGKSRRGLDRELSETDVASYFSASRCADETASKPSPEMLLELLAQTRVAAEAAIVVGDTTYDLEMAASAGVAAIGVSYGAHSPAQLQDHRPRAIIDTIDELPAAIARALGA